MNMVTQPYCNQGREAQFLISETEYWDPAMFEVLLRTEKFEDNFMDLADWCQERVFKYIT